MTIPRHEHLALLAAATGKPKEFWIAHPATPLSPAENALLQRWRQARSNGVPLAYLLGTREFYGRCFWVNPHTLIPRADTELLIDTAKTQVSQMALKEPARLADLGTGSGCIAASLALEIPNARVTASDVSFEALTCARNNAAWLGVSNQVSFVQGSWWAALGKNQAKFHAILSNPPYIAAADTHLGQGDLRFEPAGALTPLAGNMNSTGLEAIEEIVGQARRYLEPGGFLLIEHGFDQQAAVLALFRAAGLSQVQGLQDLAGNPRAVLGFHRES